MLPTLRIVLSLLACLMVPSAAQAAVIDMFFLVTNQEDFTQTYAATIGLPLAPDLYGFASAEGTLTVTPGQTGTGTADLAGEPFFFIGFANDGLAEVDLGVGTGTSSCIAVRVPEICTFPLVTNSFAPTDFDAFFARMKFTLTEGATASFTGRLTLEPEQPAQVPEPSSLLLLATGAAGAWRARRRNR